MRQLSFSGTGYKTVRKFRPYLSCPIHCTTFWWWTSVSPSTSRPTDGGKCRPTAPRCLSPWSPWPRTAPSARVSSPPILQEVRPHVQQQWPTQQSQTFGSTFVIVACHSLLCLSSLKNQEIIIFLRSIKSKLYCCFLALSQPREHKFFFKDLIYENNWVTFLKRP